MRQRNYVAADAIPWLLLEASVVGDGPTGGDRLLQVRRIQRLNTVEGKAPVTGRAVANDIGKRALVPYEADYYFYKEKAGKPAQGDWAVFDFEAATCRPAGDRSCVLLDYLLPRCRFGDPSIWIVRSTPLDGC